MRGASVALCICLALAACGDSADTAGTRPVDNDTGDSDAGMDTGTDAPEDPTPPGFVHITAGSFTIGSPAGELGRSDDEQQHRVTLSRDFYLSAHEATQDDYATATGSNPSGYRACGGDCPVESISWFDAVAYANARSAAEGLDPCYLEPQFQQPYTTEDAGEMRDPLWPEGIDCKGYRLPTEAEWEYAARAGSGAAFHGGDITDAECSDPVLDGIGWYCGNGENQTHTVGEKAPNDWGLYDVHGNVWEWSWDGFADYPDEDATDPTGPEGGNLRVQRGGAWSFSAQFCRAATRTGVFAGQNGTDVGVRLARTVFFE
jgi:formylglycine-generating enzyme required for sulfatase activity